MANVNVNESRYGPARDLDATLRKYVDDYGIGPWEVYEFNPGNAKDLHEYGQPVERSWRLAVTQLNSSVG
jgi:methylmalonyl-CoA/ethylmalonyl-CoA epimerase